VTTTVAPAVAGLAYHDGRFVPLREAVLGVTTQALQYGTGVFEGIRAYPDDRGGLSLFRVADHFRRFLNSCRVLRIDLGLDERQLTEIGAELLRREGASTAMYLRPLAYKHRLLPGTPPGVQLRGVSDGLSINAFRLGSYTDRAGIRCAISAWRRPSETMLPVRAKITGGYVNNALALDDARAAGYADAILLNSRGQVAEATTSNVFAVRDGRLWTPPLCADILDGITRDTVLTLAREVLGLPAGAADLTRDDLFTADEVFLTGTGAEIVPVVQLAGRPIGTGRPGPATTALTETYHSAVHGRLPAYAHWCTPI
jgi:branched-chain amino acid aminotransferase